MEQVWYLLMPSEKGTMIAIWLHSMIDLQMSLRSPHNM